MHVSLCWAKVDLTEIFTSGRNKFKLSYDVDGINRLRSLCPEGQSFLQKFGGKTNLGHDGVMKSFLIICEHTNMCKMSNYHRNVGAFLRGNATKVTAMTTPTGHLFTHLLNVQVTINN